MIQPEESTAALIARLHEELNASKAECLQWRKDIDEERTVRQTHEGRSQSLHRALAKERSAFEAAESARIAWAERCIAIEKERDEFRASHAALDRLLAERTRERDEAQDKARKVTAELAEHVKNYGSTYADLAKTVKERDEAREQLVKLEWPIMFGWGHEDACALCKGCKPTDRPKYTADNYGHRPTCWFAKKEAGANKIRNHRKDCPARTADDVAWVDSQWQVNGCRTSPIEGPRPNPIGCEGCKCATAKEGAAKPPTLREQWKTKQAHYDHWLDAVGYMLVGVDWAKGKSVTVTTDRPLQPGAAFAYDQASGIWKLVNEPSEPARPEPRFKVGEKVSYRGQLGMVNDILSGSYFVGFATGALLWLCDDDLKPAPKFAVGEWVTWRNVAGEIAARRWSPDLSQWEYALGGAHITEAHLTAQTPQHKHDCEGCVFLGRMGKWDLWFSAKGSGFVPGPSVFANGGSDPLGEYCEWSALEPTSPRYRRDVYSSMDETMEEARRRSVARGLVKP